MIISRLWAYIYVFFFLCVFPKLAKLFKSLLHTVFVGLSWWWLLGANVIICIILVLSGSMFGKCLYLVYCVLMLEMHEQTIDPDWLIVLWNVNIFIYRKEMTKMPCYRCFVVSGISFTVELFPKTSMISCVGLIVDSGNKIMIGTRKEKDDRIKVVFLLGNPQH